MTLLKMAEKTNNFEVLFESYKNCDGIICDKILNSFPTFSNEDEYEVHKTFVCTEYLRLFRESYESYFLVFSYLSLPFSLTWSNDVANFHTLSLLKLYPLSHEQ